MRHFHRFHNTHNFHYLPDYGPLTLHTVLSLSCICASVTPKSRLVGAGLISATNTIT